MKKVLNFFGLSLKKDFDLVLKKNEELNKSIMEKDVFLNSLESFDNFVPEIDFETYKELKGEKKRFSFNSELFHEFYNLYHRNQRQAYLIRKLAHKDYKMLHVFLMEFSSFDWEDVQKHMEEVGWKWHNSKETPTIEMLKNAVIELISFDFNKIGDVQSGGFSVGLYYTEEGEPFCKIKFDKKSYLY
jgi:hypothetical protein